MTTAREIYQRLATRFSADRGYIFEAEVEVRGDNTYNRADGIALGFWKRSGLMQAIGFEVKAARQDWLRELDNVEKQQLLMSQCNQFYLVVTDRSIVKDFELPEGWGLMVPSGKRLRIAIRSHITPHHTLAPKTLAKMIERLHRKSPTATQLRAARDGAFQEGRETERKLKRGGAQDYDKLRKALDDFEAASGIHISDFEDGTRLGALVKLAKRFDGRWGSIDGILTGLSRHSEEVLRFVADTRKTVATLKEEE